MTIDYDRLRELLEQWHHGDEVSDQLEAQWDMELAAPDMARELLRLHDGVKSVRDGMADLHHAGRVYRTKKTNATIPALSIARHLTGLLNGDTE